MIFGILLFLFIIVCIFLCLLILIQSDKGGGISGAVGGGLSGANNFLGTQDTANVLTKGTYIFGTVFLALCVLMTFFVGGRGGVSSSALQKRAESQTITAAPATPISGFGAETEGAEGEATAIQGMFEGSEEGEALSE